MEKIKLTDEVKATFLATMAEKGFDVFTKSIKDASDEETGIFEVVITTEDTDRMGEVIMLDGWDIGYYMKNPVVLWGHDHYRMPVGVCLAIERRDGSLVARGKFAPSADGQELRRLYDLGIIRATSVGFIEKERNGNVITKAELIEFSFVSVPANPMALSTLIKSNISVNDLVTKGFIKLDIKDVEENETVSGDEKDEEKKDEEIIDEKIEDDEVDGEKMVKISKAKLASIKLALKEAGDVLDDVSENSVEGDSIDDQEHIEKDEDAEDKKNETVESETEKALRHFNEGRRLAQIASTALADSLAHMRKHVDSK